MKEGNFVSICFVGELNCKLFPSIFYFISNKQELVYWECIVIKILSDWYLYIYEFREDITRHDWLATQSIESTQKLLIFSFFSLEIKKCHKCGEKSFSNLDFSVCIDSDSMVVESSFCS